MGEAGADAEGASSALPSSCWRRSGDAFRRNQVEELGETATCACVRGRRFALPWRTAEQFAQLQFHWGKPPPAAEPRTFTRIPAYLPLAVRDGSVD